MNEVKIDTEFIKLDSLLKWSGIVGLGSEAKHLIQEGEVLLNGEVETQRGKKIRKGDLIQVSGEIIKVV